MKPLALLLLLFCSPALVFAQAKPFTLGAWLNQTVQLGYCEKSWINDRDFKKIIHIEKADLTVVAVPCASWGHNLRWMVFSIHEKIVNKNPFTASRFKQHFFTHYEINRSGIVSTMFVENYRWDATTNLMFSRTYKNSKSHCGEIAEYHFDHRYDRFFIKRIAHQTNCLAPGKWQVIQFGDNSAPQSAPRSASQ